SRIAAASRPAPSWRPGCGPGPPAGTAHPRPGPRRAPARAAPRAAAGCGRGHTAPAPLAAGAWRARPGRSGPRAGAGRPDCPSGRRVGSTWRSLVLKRDVVVLPLAVALERDLDDVGFLGRVDRVRELLAEDDLQDV